jgi:DNA-binding CsgD family transcriptional regulator
MKLTMLGVAAAATVAMAIPAVAQPINQREHRQEQRIRRGVASGQLTPAEARRLRYLEMRLHRTEARMRWRNGGRLSPAQRARLQQMADRDNAEIYRLKHNYRRY